MLCLLLSADHYKTRRGSGKLGNKLSGLFPSSRDGFNSPHNAPPHSSSSRYSLVKEGLRHAIHARRALSHNPIIRPEDLVPKDVKFKLTPEEEEKRKVRREKNKLAASKCRNKKREMVNTTKKEFDRVTTHNSRMEREIELLKSEKQRLQHTLSSHSCSMGGSSSFGSRLGSTSSSSLSSYGDHGRGENMAGPTFGGKSNPILGGQSLASLGHVLQGRRDGGDNVRRFF